MKGFTITVSVLLVSCFLFLFYGSQKHVFEVTLRSLALYASQSDHHINLSIGVRKLAPTQCERCNPTLPCRNPSKSCVHRRCVVRLPSKAYNASLSLCFPNLRRCSICTADSQCREGKCIHNRCARDEETAQKLCSILLGETCARCNTDSQCQSRRCYYHRCMPRGDGSAFIQAQSRCFPNFAECAICTLSKQCGGPSLCWKGRCVLNDSFYSRQLSIAKCASKLSGSCAECRVNSQCGSNLCVRGRCVSSTSRTAISKCFPKMRRCALCTLSAQCALGGCFRGRCIASIRESRVARIAEHEHCSQKLPVCAKCVIATQCQSGKCLRGKCVTGANGNRSLNHCNGGLGVAQLDVPKLNPTCGSCTSDNECESGSCIYGKCLAKYSLPSSASKCYTRDLPCARCGKCNHGSICKAGICIRRNRFSADSRLCFRSGHRCARCTSNHHCTGAMDCKRSRCVPKNQRSQVIRRCMGAGRRCDPCSDDSECNGKRCILGRCAPCRKRRAVRECHDCTREGDCAPGLICVSGVCLRDARIDISEKLCFPDVGECGLCAYDYDCNNHRHVCVYGRCVESGFKKIARSVKTCFGELKSPSSSQREWGGSNTCLVRRVTNDSEPDK